MKKESLGDRMKSQYEKRTKYFLPRRTYTIIRLDGKAFHTFTKGFDRPFDKDFAKAMDITTRELCENIQGAKIGYVQSDEISILLTDFEDISTNAWFDGNIQKIASVSSSMCSAFFNRAISDLKPEKNLAFFDARVFTIPDVIEVENYFIWRQQDATRNSISMAAQCFYSQSELNKKNTSQMQEMLFQAGKNWNNYDDGFKRGRVCKKYSIQYTPAPSKYIWGVSAPPIFTKEREYLGGIIPNMPTR